MISSKQFGELSQKEKFQFIIKVLDQVKPQGIFEDLRQLFRVVKNPSEDMLVMIFEIIEAILNYAEDKNNSKKQASLSLIQQKLRTLKDKEHEEKQDLKSELEELLEQLD